MLQVATSLIFAVAACMGLAVIIAMLKQNSSAILSALAGHGAFPVQPSPETGPAAELGHILRPSRRSARRGSLVNDRPDFAHGLSYAA